MKKILIFVFGLAFILGAGLAWADPPNQDSQEVQMEIKAINTFVVSGNPQKLEIDYAEPGQDPEPAYDQTTTYSISTNGNNKKIVASLNQAMPDYTALKVQLAAPQGATSAGYVTLGTSAQDLVTGISKKRASGLEISYEFSAQIEAEPQSFSRTVTFVLTGGS